MRIAENLLEYVSGAAFSELHKVDIEQPTSIRHRFDVIEALVRGKSVIDVGCVDHVPLIADKIREGTWFHGLLMKAASRCIGIDINAEGVARASAEFGIADLHYGDVAADAGIAAILAGTWDFLILGEVLEHIDNPVAFLRAVVANYGDRIDRIVVTVPNAFRAGNVLATFKNQEWINSDHRYWFTPYTLMKVTAGAGLRVESIELCHFSHTKGLKRSLKDVVLNRFPLLSEDIVAVCKTG